MSYTNLQNSTSRYNTKFARGLALVLLLIAACVEKPISQLSPEEGIGRLRKFHDDRRWDETISQVNEYRSRYPYSQFASEAELIQADAYFQAGRYPEAIVAYEDFLKKNPNHKDAPLAGFRIAKSYDNQSPEEVDREQDFALQAIDKYNIFIERFSTSPLAVEAKERMSVLNRRIAEHFVFVARFYWKKDLYHGALSRYLQVLDRYSRFEDLTKEARERAAQAYLKLAEVLEKEPKSDTLVYFRNTTPQELRQRAQELSGRK